MQLLPTWTRAQASSNEQVAHGELALYFDKKRRVEMMRVGQQ